MNNDQGHRTELSQRADIDGLRAVAVLAVVFYHAGVRGFSGGFVGVDVFFVISGFLITRILNRSVGKEQHLISEFYRRRVLRIFPALFAMYLVVALFATVSLIPTEFNTFARSLAASSLFLSNVQFYRETDYFGVSAAVQPLLHTWSLAIEEQWYVIWPLVIAALGKRGMAWTRSTCVCLLTLSALASIWLLPIDAPAAFYLLPARAWELALGALLALTPSWLGAGWLRDLRWLKEICGALGLTLILFGIKAYTHETPFPGWAAMPPCLGTALVILSGEGGSLVASALSIRPAQLIGKISFSLYLWHWPVLIFSQICFFLPQTPLFIIAEIMMSLLLAAMSWQLIEQPLRHMDCVKTRTVLISAVVLTVSTVAFSAMAIEINARVMQLTARQAKWAKYLDLDGDGLYRRGKCFAVGPKGNYNAAECIDRKLTKPAILITGDSHAAALWPGLSRWQQQFEVLQATATGCVSKQYTRPEHLHCERILNHALSDWLPAHRPFATLLASRWKLSNLDGLEQTLRNPELGSAHAILIGPIPEYGTALPRLLVFADRRNDPGVVVKSLQAQPFEVDQAMRAIAAQTGTPYISLIDLLCREGVCQTLTPTGVPLQFDSSHLTREGSEYLVDRLMPMIVDIAKRIQ